MLTESDEPVEEPELQLLKLVEFVKATQKMKDFSGAKKQKEKKIFQQSFPKFSANVE